VIRIHGIICFVRRGNIPAQEKAALIREVTSLKNHAGNLDRACDTQQVEQRLELVVRFVGPESQILPRQKTLLSEPWAD